VKYLAGALLCLVLICGTSCGIDKTFVMAVDGYADAILPDYERLLKADTTIPEDSKALRLKTVDEFRQLIKEAKEAK
jgi:hypothetical protein